MNTNGDSDIHLLSAVETQPVRRQRSKISRLFVGPFGVRTGWKILLFLLLFVGVALGLRPVALWVAHRTHSASASPEFALLRELIGVGGVLIATAVMARWVDRKPVGYFGIPAGEAFGSKFWVGVASGLGTLALQLELMHLGGWFDFGTVQLQGLSILHYGLAWAAMFLCVGITEEGLLRGYLLRVSTDGLSRLSGVWSFWVAALVLSLLFGAAHLGNAGETKFGIFMVFLDGMVMCFSLWRTGNLWFAIGNHAAWDWGQTFLFGTPNSGYAAQGALMRPSVHGPVLLAGGSDGPEGSVLVLISEGLVLLVVAVLYRQRQFRLVREGE